jgi:hypothetical protein
MSCSTCSHIYGHASSCPWFLEEVQSDLDDMTAERDALRGRVEVLEKALEVLRTYMGEELEARRMGISIGEDYWRLFNLYRELFRTGKK